MPSENLLIQVRRAFRIPDSIVIVTAASIIPKITGSQIGTQPAGSKYNIPQGDTPDEALSTSSLGTKVYTNIRFLPKTYTDNRGRTVTTPDKTFDSILITVNQTKNIVKTAIQGANGTVKEYIGDGDYSIQVNGIITGSNGVRPVDDVADLKKILDAPVALDIACDYLQSLGVDSAVVENYEIGQTEGSYSYQTFSITLASDLPVQLRLSNFV